MLDINSIFNALMAGDASVIIDENINTLNSEALILYNTEILDSEQIEKLKQIIMICNVLYNRTDMTILPIEDGFYDLLLEKYKTYDSNFQVGSAVIDFKNFIENDLDKSIAECPIIFAKDNKEKDEIHQSMYNDIMRVGKDILTIEDFYTCPIEFTDDSYITKRAHNTEHNHPTLVGTLDKCKFVLNEDAIKAGVFDDPNVKILERDFFQNHISKGILNPNDEISIVCELKYDGISVEADCVNTVLSARTRGDTGIGVASDITPILKNYPFNHAGCMIGENPLGVKFEAIMTKSCLYRFNEMRGRSYANCRSAIVGLFGASDAYLFRDLITLVPLAVDSDQIKFDNRVQEIEFINSIFRSHGEPLRYCYFSGNVATILYLIKVFWDEAKLARDYLDFLYDGIVISYADEKMRKILGRKNFINKFSMAVKFDPAEKQTIFRGYTFEVGQNGAITPMIHYDPVEFIGTIHTKSTGSSYKRFTELGLKYGDYINVTYVNDVMPYVSKLECEHNRNNTNPLFPFTDTCPICGSKLLFSDSGKTIICPNMNCNGRSLQRMVNMFSKMNIKGFAEASFKALKATHLYELAFISPLKAIELLGDADGKSFIEAMKTIMNNPIHDYIVIGALGFTSIAHKKWQSILQNMSIADLWKLYNDNYPDKSAIKAGILNYVPNIGTVTLDTIVDEIDFFVKDLEFILNNMNIISSKGKTVGTRGQIRFTGCRNKQLEEQLNTAGWDASDSSVTKKTDILIVPYEGFNSTKVSNAKKNSNTKIISIDNFIKNINDYI